MKQKIEWYREVLELEPGSRVFFPLAKLLAEDGQFHDAVITLRQGVLRHPDHVEARLLLVDLLAKQGVSSDLAVEVERLGSLFAGYPGFWSAWGNQLADNPAMQDAALAIRFFAAALQGQPLTWASIIEHGIQALLAEPAASSFASSGRPVAVTATGAHSFSSEENLITSGAIQTLDDDSFDETSKDAPVTLKELSQEGKFDLSSGEADEEDESEETFSLRTRSMAEVLAEQGDVAGALDIFKELILAATEEEKPSLETRAEELSRRMASGSSSQESSAEGAVEQTARDGNRLIGLLESLAERLEARAR